MIYPDRRLLALTASLLASAVVAVAAPSLWAPLAAVAAALVVLAAGDAVALVWRPRVTAERTLPERATVGTPSTVRLSVANPGGAAVRVSLLDETPEDVGDEPHADLTVPPRATREVTYAVTPARRGDRVFGPLHVLEASPRGWWRRRTACDEGTVLAVHPDTRALVGRHALAPHRVRALLGVRPVRRRGEGMEFESLREYVPGDDPRRIDWPATVRRHRLVTRQHQHERNHTVIVAVDASRLMAVRVGVRTKLDCAVDAALAVVHAALGAGDRAGLVVFDRAVRAYVPPRAHRRRFGAFVDVLRTTTPVLGEVDYGVLARTLAVRQRQQALLVVLTDVLEPDDAQLAALATLGRRHRMLLVTVRDPLLDALAPSRDPAGDTADALYRRIALDDLVRHRDLALATLRRAGIEAADLPPSRLTPAVLDRYLPLRLRAA
jgi:uncharacterized protein (DUF58 family)